MIIIDGSQGEGGGQILRSALALAMCTQQAVKISAIRARRNKPGLMRQHLTALKAAATLCSARIDGAHIGADEILFEPGPVTPGHYTFAVGSAGSTGLVMQTVLPALMLAAKPSVVIFEGGTHNPFAPPFDFIERAFLPLLNRMGAQLKAVLQRPGFYPAGGGRWMLTIEPVARLRSIALPERGALISRKATALRAGLPGHIADRELNVIGRKLGWEDDCLEHRQYKPEYGPGNCLIIVLQYEHITEVITGFGQHGTSAEKVADHCVKKTKRYLASGAPVGEYLADQLLLPVALAGKGEFITLTPSRHMLTNIDIIQRFLPVRFHRESLDNNNWLIRCTSAD